jgi:chromosome segregation ATPase
LEKEVSALRAEVRQALNGLETCETPAAIPAEELSSLKEELAALAQLRTEDTERIQSAITALERKLNESDDSLAGLPGNLESLKAQIESLDEKIQPLSARVDKASKTADEVPQTVEDVQRDLVLLQDQARQIQERLQTMEERLEILAVEPTSEPQTPLHSDMHAIRENLDEIRRFMATVAQKI